MTCSSDVIRTLEQISHIRCEDQLLCAGSIHGTHGFRVIGCTLNKHLPSPRRLCRYNTTKSESIATVNRDIVAATRRKQRVGVERVPRRTAHHAVLRLSIVPIFAPLPYVPSHVVQTKLVGLKAAHRTSPWITGVIAFND